MANITGTTAADTLFATTQADSINGGGGADFIAGVTVANIGNTIGYGNDTIVTGAGNSTIIAGASSVITTGAGNAAIILGFNGTTTGNETVNLGTGTNIVLAVSGNNTINGGGAGAIDLIVGGTGNDSIVAKANELTVIQAGSGNQTLDASKAFASILIGGVGNDVLIGGASSNTITSGAGANLITGGAGNDLITVNSQTRLAAGGGGTDTLVIGEAVTAFTQINLGAANQNAAGGNTVLQGFLGLDLSQTRNNVNASGITGTVLAATNAATITGGSGADTLQGGAGNDKITMGTGNSQFVDSGGNDSVAIGSGNDTLQFGTQADLTLTTATAGTGTKETLQFNFAAAAVNASDLAKIKGINTLQISTGADTINFTDAMLQSLLPTGTTAINVVIDTTPSAGAMLNFNGVTGAYSLSVTQTSNAKSQFTSANISAPSNVTSTIATSAGGLSLLGTTANDNLVGGTANDFFQFATGTLAAGDTVTGGAGTDTLDLGSGAAATNFNAALMANKTGVDVIQIDNMGTVATSDSITATPALITALTDSGALQVRFTTGSIGGSGQTFTVTSATGSAASLTLNNQTNADNTADATLSVTLDNTGEALTLATAKAGGTSLATTIGGTYSVTGGTGADTIIGGATNSISIAGGGGVDSITATGNGDVITAVTGTGSTVSISGLSANVTVTNADGTNVDIAAGGLGAGAAASKLQITPIGPSILTWSGFDSVTVTENGSGAAATLTNATFLNGLVSTESLTIATGGTTPSLSINGSAVTLGKLNLSDSGVTHGAGVVTIIGTASADTIVGSTGVNTGAESINGGAGADNITVPTNVAGGVMTIDGGAGADSISGGHAANVYNYLIGTGGTGDFGDTIANFTGTQDILNFKFALVNGSVTTDGGASVGITALNSSVEGTGGALAAAGRVVLDIAKNNNFTGSLTSASNIATNIASTFTSITGLNVGATVLLEVTNGTDLSLFIDKVSTANTIVSSDLTFVGSITATTDIVPGTKLL